MKEVVDERCFRQVLLHHGRESGVHVNGDALDLVCNTLVLEPLEHHFDGVLGLALDYVKDLAGIKIHKGGRVFVAFVNGEFIDSHSTQAGNIGIIEKELELVFIEPFDGLPV